MPGKDNLRLIIDKLPDDANLERFDRLIEFFSCINTEGNDIYSYKCEELEGSLRDLRIMYIAWRDGKL